MLALAASALADPPKLTGTSPVGVPRGRAMDVTVSGSGLVDHPRLVAPFPFRLEELVRNGSDAAKWKITLTVDAAAAVGVYPIRVATDSGVSDPDLFAVGHDSQVPGI